MNCSVVLFSYREGCKFIKKANSLKAEFEGLILGLRAAKKAGIKDLKIIGDCNAVVESMQVRMF